MAVTLRAAMFVACALVASCANVECSLNSECGARARCELNRCVRDCVEDRDCASGEFCNLNGACSTGARPPEDRPDPADVPTPDDRAPPADIVPDVVFDGGFDVGIDAPVDNGPPRDTDPPIDVAVPDVIAPDVTAPDVIVPDVTAPDVVAPDVISIDVSTPDVPRPDVTTPDAPRPDATTGPVGVGVYSYTGIRPDTLTAPVAVAWHPSGTYALILSSSNTVFRFDVLTMAVSRVAMTTSSIAWRGVTFTPDGARAILLASSGSGTTRLGRVFVWEHATSTLTERMADQWTMGVYESLRWSADGRRGALLGSARNYLSIWWIGPDGARAGGPIAHGRVPDTACNDLAWVADGFGDPALTVVCGTNTGEILSVTNLSGTSVFAQAIGGNPGAVGNTSRISLRPQGDVALAVGNSSGKLYRYGEGMWRTGFSSPMVTGSFGVAFSTDGARALAFGGFGRVHEYRFDLYSTMDITDATIGLASAPFSQPSTAQLRDLAWRPGCEEGLAVGGAFSPSSAFVAYFRVTNGRRCP